MDLSLSALMCQAQAGDSLAYTKLLREVSGLLRDFVRSRRRNSSPSDVEDLVQEILISLHAVRSTYDPARPFTPWLLAIARNRMADGARKFGRALAQEAKSYDVVLNLYSPDQPDGEPGPDNEALTAAIERLPASQRKAIELTKLREMSLEEASRETGATVGAMKLLVHRAMKSLRKAMGKV